MHIKDQDAWRDDALDVLMVALSTDHELRAALIFKGARILSARLGKPHRFSRDIDASMTQEFVDGRPEANQQEHALESLTERAVTRHLARSNPIRYRLESIRIVRRPRRGHPRGWSAFRVSLRLLDLKHPGVRGLPALELDVAAPEPLGEHSVAPLRIDGNDVLAYTLERQTGDKMKAFLTSLPAYRNKLGGDSGDRIRRVKYLYDIATVERARPTDTEPEFWVIVGEEFRVAAEGRGVDCRGIETFSQGMDETRSHYDESEIFKHDIPFDEVWSALKRILDILRSHKLIPFEFELPPPRN